MKNLKKALLVLLGLAVIAGSGQFLPRLNTMRREYDLTAGEPLSNAPPELVLATTALAGMRGILVDMLWMRALKREREGKYFELVQLYDWIGKLEPRFPTVWRFASWNMAYNVSKSLTTPQDRWRWIERGIELLRDKGIRYNPREPDLYRELAQIYAHRIGSRLDLFHRQFKVMLAEDMQRVLGEEQDIKGMAAAPESRRELMRDAKVKELVELLARHEIDPFATPLKFANDRMELPESVEQRLAEPDLADARGRLSLFLRARYLREVLKLDPDRMLALMEGPQPEGYGPMDWRLPFPHAIYWSREAQRRATDEQQSMNDDRQIHAALKRLLEGGKLYFEPSAPGKLPVYYTEYNWRFADRLDELFLDLIKQTEGGAGTVGLKNAHRDFLQETIQQLYISNQPEKAREYFKKVRRLYPSDDQNKPLPEYVEAQLRDRILEYNSNVITGMIVHLFRRAYIALAFNDDERALGLVRLARQIYNSHVNYYRARGVVLDIAPIEQLNRRAMFQVLNTLTPQIRKNLEEKVLSAQERQGQQQDEEQE